MINKNKDILTIFTRMGLVIIMLVLALVYFLTPCHGAPVSEKFIHALHAQEASLRMNPPDGDGGKAIGPFQIHESYWKDSRVSGKYQDCHEYKYALRVVTAYLNRYCPQAVKDNNFEVMARTHNGGPTGAKRSSTLTYWDKFRQRLR